MAVLFSVQSGNWTTSTTWKVVDPTSFANTETGGTTLTTSFQTSSAFTPGAITVEGIAVKISSRIASPSGTITVRLSTGGSAVAGTTVTLNVSDLPLTTFSAPTSFYWCYFKFSSPVTLLAATAYNVQATTSASTQVSLGHSTSTANFIRCLVTSTNATPTTRDTLIVAGEHTSAGVGSDYIVTMDNTSGTIFGSSSAVFPALEIGRRGIVSFGISESTSYQLVCNGAINIGGGGILNIGTSGNPIPSSSSALIRFTMSSNNQFQINVRQFGYLYSYGATKSGRALLGSNASLGASTITTSTSTDWNQGDNIVIAPTTNSAAGFNFLTMSATASGTTITLTGTLSNAKTIWANTDCEIINLTRNVRIVGGLSSSVDSLHTYNGQITIDMDYTEFNFGAISNSATDTTSTSLINFVGCSFWGGSARNLITDSSIPSGMTVSFDDCVFHNLNGIFGAGNLFSTTQSTVKFTNSWGIRAASNWSFPSGGNSFTIDNCRFIASAASGIVFGNNNSYDTGPIIIRNSVFKCNTSAGISFASGAGAYTLIGEQHDISNNRMYLNAQFGFASQGGVGYSWGWIIGQFEAFSNATANVNLDRAGEFRFLGATLYGGPTQSSAIGVRSLNPQVPITLENFIMSTHSTADVSTVNTSQISQLIFKNSSFLSTTKVQSPTTLISKPSYVYSARDGQIDGTHIIYRFNGTIRSDLTIFRTFPSSLRLSPLSSVYKIETTPVYVPVEDGKTITVGVWVRRSVAGDGADYNGNLPRLICKVNSATWTGITDVILATASDASSGAFEYISGTTPVAIDNSAFEIVVDCDGTAGWVNIDDMYISKQNATKGFKYWVNASPVPTSMSNNGSSVIFL
jgi:hypothetical protein